VPWWRERGGLDRVTEGAPPAEIPQSWLETGAFNTGSPATIPVKQNLPFIVFSNTDSATHTITLTSRAALGVGTASVQLNVPAGGVVSVPTSVFSGAADGTLNGLCFWFYSDVNIGSGPSAGGGAPASTVLLTSTGKNLTPTVGGTVQMGGLGSTLAITPKKTGLVRVQITLNFSVYVTTVSAQVTWCYGTGSPPALNGAQVGTAGHNTAIIEATGTFTQVETGFTLVQLFQLTAGTTYWFDLQCELTTAGDGAIFSYDGSVEELAQ
jgi:hypothetical protein